MFQALKFLMHYFISNLHVGGVVKSASLHGVHGALQRAMLTIKITIYKLGITPGGIIEAKDIRNLHGNVHPSLTMPILIKEHQLTSLNAIVSGPFIKFMQSGQSASP